MSSLYIRLSKAAIKAKLTKNESLIFHALMIQTLGYRKSANELTDKRVAYLAGLRLDHFRTALNSLLQKNLFYRVEYHEYDYQYRICDRFFVKDGNNTVCSPSLPNTGKADFPNLEQPPEVGTDSAQILENSPKTGQESPPSSGKLAENSGSRGHTIKNINIKKQQQTQTKPKTEKNQTKKITNTNNTEKNSIEEKQHTIPTVSISFSDLEVLSEQLVIESSQPIRLELSAKDIRKIPQAEQPMQEEKVVENESKTVVDKKPVSEPIESFVQPEETESEGSEWIETVSQPMTTTHAKTVAELANNLVADSKLLTQNDNIAAPLTLPNVIDAEDRPACLRHFQQLDEQQRKDVLTVFNQQLKTGSIKSKTKYFIGLAKKAQQGGLTIPSAAKQTASTTSSTIAINSPEHFAMLKEANKEQEARALLWSDYQGLKQLALLNKTSEQETAVIMGMEDAYAAFGQQETLENSCAV